VPCSSNSPPIHGRHEPAPENAEAGLLIVTLKEGALFINRLPGRPAAGLFPKPRTSGCGRESATDSTRMDTALARFATPAR
jgi:hypothetical protein